MTRGHPFLHTNICAMPSTHLLPLAAASTAEQRLQKLAQMGRPFHCQRETLLLRQGEVSDQILIVLQGRMRVYTSNREGRQLTLAEVKAVDMVGEMSLDGGGRSANVQTIDPCVCVSIERKVLLDFVRQEPEFAMDLMCRVIARARMATRQASDLALLNAYHRLTQWLDQHAQTDEGNGLRYVPKIKNQTELAQQLGCSREMISRLMKDLEQNGYLKVQGQHFLLCKALPQRW